MSQARRRTILPRGNREDKGGRVRTRDTGNPGRRWGIWILLAGLLAATLAAYMPVWHGGMLWDDEAHITRSELRPAAGLWRIWTELGATQQYYPIVHSAFWIQYRLWGEDTLGYHIVNILLHALAAFLVALILGRLEVPGAWLAALIFALHPVQVESVAWISELKNTLSGVLYLGAALAYLRFDENRQGRHYALALSLFVVALLSKTVTATLPAALLVVFWWRRGTLNRRRDVLPLIPFFALGIAAGISTAWVERNLIGAEGADFQFTLLERGLIAGRAIWFYLGKLVWPADLIFIYPRWQISQDAWRQYMYPLGAVLLLAVLWWWRKRSRAPLAALLFFSGTLFPALGFFNVYPFVFSYVADHFQYLASLGVIALASAGLTMLSRRLKIRGKPATAATIVLAGLLGSLTWAQSRQYASAETLYRTTISRNPECWMAYNNLGYLKLRGSLEDAAAAVAPLEDALRLRPRYPGAHNNLGMALQRLGRFQEAAAHYREALRLRPDFPEAAHNLGVALETMGHSELALRQYTEALKTHPDSPELLVSLGQILQGMGRLEEALANIRQALKLNPDYAEAHNSLGNVLQAMNRSEDAMQEYRETLRLKPEYAEAHTNLGIALQEQGRFEEAAAQHREALRLAPDLAEAHHNLGNVLKAMGRLDNAVTQYREAIRCDAAFAEAYNSLGQALLIRGRMEEALSCFGKALQLKSDYAQAHFNLANGLQAAGRLKDAVTHYREALKSQPGSAETHNNLGVALAALGRIEDAAAEFGEALRLKPDYIEARSNLARAGKR